MNNPIPIFVTTLNLSLKLKQIDSGAGTAGALRGVMNYLLENQINLYRTENLEDMIDTVHFLRTVHPPNFFIRSRDITVRNFLKDNSELFVIKLSDQVVGCIELKLDATVNSYKVDLVALDPLMNGKDLLKKSLNLITNIEKFAQKGLFMLIPARQPQLSITAIRSGFNFGGLFWNDQKQSPHLHTIWNFKSGQVTRHFRSKIMGKEVVLNAPLKHLHSLDRDGQIELMKQGFIPVTAPDGNLGKIIFAKTSALKLQSANTCWAI